MSFKVRLEIDPNGGDEVIIKCRSVNEEVLRLEALISSNASGSEIELHLNGNDYFIKLNDVLFFETDGSKTAAHTADRMFYTDLKLYELVDRLPRSFMRISKSAILNANAVSSLRKELTGICEASFRNTAKKIYISRSYYKPFREMITELRTKGGF